ncbi:MAG: FAD-binding oxidoreductase [Gallionella sp.]
MHADFLAALVARVGQSGVLTAEAAAPYCRDWRGRYSGVALAVVLPADTAQVAEVVKLCAARGIAIVPQGGNTSLCGAGVPLETGDQIVLNLSRMKHIRSVDAANYTMTVEAGCTLSSIYTVAEEYNRLFPLGLTAIAPHCEIGGNLSTNAGGIGVLRYGNARDLVLGLEVVLPDGQVWNGLRSLRKDNTGYDLKHLFIGAEGTLGIITAAVLKLFPRPHATATACVAITHLQAAVRLLTHIRGHCGDTLSGFELISRSCLDLVFEHIPDTEEPFAQQYDYYVLIKLADVRAGELENGLRAALQSFGAEILAFDTTTGDAEHWWILRKNIAEAQKREGLSIKHDIAVPISRVAEFITRANAALRAAYPTIRIIAFGHLGDGNIHYNVSLPDAAANSAFIQDEEPAVNTRVYAVVRDLNGSISAEHGIGQLKRDTLCDHKDPLELELMRKIKATLDPQGLMNPGKVV